MAIENGSIVEVQEKHAIDRQALLAWMSINVDGFKGPGQLRQFAGGQSNPTYILSTADTDYVIRRKPPGKLLPSAHAVDREYRVIDAVYSQGYSVARPYALCMDESVIGTIFYVMGYCEGLVGYEHTLPSFNLDQRANAYESFLANLAKLHSYDYKAIGLEDFGRPGNYFQRQISRWSKQYIASQTHDIPQMDKLMEWLPKNVPDADITCLVHGDYSTHNTMFDTKTGDVTAVLDWELSTIGDPLGDLYYSIRPWYSPGEKIPSMTADELKAKNIPSMDEMVAKYCVYANRPLITEHSFYQAYILFRLAGILQGIVGRVRDGTAADPNAAARAAMVEPLCKAGWEFAQQLT